MYKFRSKEFGLTLNVFHILRGGSVIKKISFSDIVMVELKFSVLTKFPFRVTIFGLVFLILSLIFFKNNFHFLFEGFSDQNSWRAYALYLTVGGFMFAIGCLALYQAIITPPVLKITCFDRSVNIFSLSEIIKQNTFTCLTDQLIKIFDNRTLRIEKKILKEYAQKRP